MEYDVDVTIIGAGVTGAAIARELSKYELRVMVLEKEEDVCSGTSKANSAIVHAGYDAMPGTWKAKMNVLGAKRIRELSKALDFPYLQNGSMVVSFSPEDHEKLEALLERGRENGVEGLEILSGEQARALEPALGSNVAEALLVPTGGIVCPFQLTLALAENAAENGVVFRFLTKVTKIDKDVEGFLLHTEVTDSNGTITKRNIKTHYVVNAAGVYADQLHNDVSGEAHKITLVPRRGEYVLMDKEAGTLVKHTIFQLPTELGKGVLVTPTVHGNLLVGPNAVDLSDKTDTGTTPEGIDDIKKRALLSVPEIPYALTITSFSGLRAHELQDDFILSECPDAPGFFDAAGIESPGLSSAPAIGEYITSLLVKKANCPKKKEFKAERKGFIEVSKLPMEKRNELIKKNPKYGVIVCRCENVSEGEILDAIHRPLGAVSLDGIKRRVRQGMGRCQAGFCTPRTMEILSKELHIPMEAVTKNRPGSEIIKG